MDEYVGKLLAHVFLFIKCLSLNVIIEPTKVIMLAVLSPQKVILH